MDANGRECGPGGTDGDGVSDKPKPDPADSVTPFTTQMNVTQAALEQWARAIPPPMQVTQAALEEWASVALYVPPPFTAIAMVLA